MKHLHGSMFLDIVAMEPGCFTVQASGPGFMRRILTALASRVEAEAWLARKIEQQAYETRNGLNIHEHGSIIGRGGATGANAVSI